LECGDLSPLFSLLAKRAGHTGIDLKVVLATLTTSRKAAMNRRTPNGRRA
jgi:hypothetical protein